ncbi:alpha/beta hydrolase family protein [Williamsia sp. CHRR-6]|uniref:alpha/beta hydrolase n=1 Tax=Williamsia sp. CHRR-6 TaxID=2835871 RepID=UPI001BD99900|nr:alpha/beta hydrolase family protein [Williamsia sp. CHRR-6]MBT0568673.1 mycolyltransferase [Williamsia sp. CHRR-6]
MIHRRSRRVAITLIASAVAVGLATAAPASAANQAQLRDGCVWRTPDEKAAFIQTCTFRSPSLGRDVAVQIRASDRAAGDSEQAIYFLDGIGANNQFSTWALPDSGALNAYSKHVNLVLPAGGAGEWMTNWKAPIAGPNSAGTAPQWDTFIGSELPAYLNAKFSVQKKNNAIAGVSMSAGPAMILALNHPDVFTTVRAFSGYYQTDNPVGWILIPYIQKDRAGITNGGTAMWGAPLSPGNTWGANDVGKRLGELRGNGQTALVSVGNGILSQRESDFVLKYGISNIPGVVFTIATGVTLESTAMTSTVALNVQSALIGAPVKFSYVTGSHDFYAWAEAVKADAATLEKVLADARTKPGNTPTTTTTKTATATTTTPASSTTTTTTKPVP